MTAAAEDRIGPSARLAIIELYARYSHAYDDGHGHEVAKLFTADGEFHRPGTEPVRGRDELAALVAAAAARGAGTRHFVSSIVLDSAAEGVVTGSAYVQVLAITADAVRFAAIGRYHDEIVFEDGGWAFRSRRFTPFATPAPTGQIPDRRQSRLLPSSTTEGPSAALGPRSGRP